MERIKEGLKKNTQGLLSESDIILKKKKLMHNLVAAQQAKR